MRSFKKEVFLWSIILIPYLCLIPAALWYKKVIREVDNSSFIVIDKANFTLYHFNFKGELIQESNIAIGINSGNKQEVGDHKTPEGVFKISSIEDASGWTHDFEGDGLGEINYAYGPYFIRLSVPNQKGIGIHGTHDNSSIGTRASEGCIRMKNDELEELVKSLKSASVVVIIPGIEDQLINFNLDDSIK